MGPTNCCNYAPIAGIGNLSLKQKTNAVVAIRPLNSDRYSLIFHPKEFENAPKNLSQTF